MLDFCSGLWLVSLVLDESVARTSQGKGVDVSDGIGGYEGLGLCFFGFPKDNYRNNTKEHGISQQPSNLKSRRPCHLPFPFIHRMDWTTPSLIS